MYGFEKRVITLPCKDIISIFEPAVIDIDDCNMCTLTFGNFCGIITGYATPKNHNLGRWYTRNSAQQNSPFTPYSASRKCTAS